MKKDDVQITVGVISNEFNFHAEGDNELAFQVMMLGLATLLENVKNDDALDTEIENLVLEEYHRAVTFLRKLSDDVEAAAERTGEGERAAQK